MKNLVIIGARPFGRETCNYARDAGWNVKGFLDDKPSAMDNFAGYPPILGSAETYIPDSADVFVCAVGDPKWREKYVGIIAAKGGVFVSVVHPTAYVGPNVKMGVGCVVCPWAIIDCDLTIGNHVDVNSQSYVPHDCTIGNFVTISPGCRLGGGVVLRDGVFLGIGAIAIPHVEVGTGAYVAAGSVVTRDVQSLVLVAGVPAVVKKRIG